MGAFLRGLAAQPWRASMVLRCWRSVVDGGDGGQPLLGAGDPGLAPPRCPGRPSGFIAATAPGRSCSSSAWRAPRTAFWPGTASSSAGWRSIRLLRFSRVRSSQSDGVAAPRRAPGPARSRPASAPGSPTVGMPAAAIGSSVSPRRPRPDRPGRAGAGCRSSARTAARSAGRVSRLLAARDRPTLRSRAAPSVVSRVLVSASCCCSSLRAPWTFVLQLVARASTFSCSSPGSPRFAGLAERGRLLLVGPGLVGELVLHRQQLALLRGDLLHARCARRRPWSAARRPACCRPRGSASPSARACASAAATSCWPCSMLPCLAAMSAHRLLVDDIRGLALLDLDQLGVDRLEPRDHLVAGRAEVLGRPARPWRQGLRSWPRLLANFSPRVAMVLSACCSADLVVAQLAAQAADAAAQLL